MKTHKQLPFMHQRMNTHKQLSFVRWKTKNIIWDMEETQIPKSCSAENTESEEKTSPLKELKLRGMVSLVKRIPKEKTCQQGKRQSLILVLSEIRCVSFYQHVMETLLKTKTSDFNTLHTETPLLHPSSYTPT